MNHCCILKTHSIARENLSNSTKELSLSQDFHKGAVPGFPEGQIGGKWDVPEAFVVVWVFWSLFWSLDSGFGALSSDWLIRISWNSNCRIFVSFYKQLITAGVDDSKIRAASLLQSTAWAQLLKLHSPPVTVLFFLFSFLSVSMHCVSLCSASFIGFISSDLQEGSRKDRKLNDQMMKTIRCLIIMRMNEAFVWTISRWGFWLLPSPSIAPVFHV